MEIVAKMLSGMSWTVILRSIINFTHLFGLAMKFTVYVRLKHWSYLVTFCFFQNQQKAYPSKATEGRGRISDAATDDIGSVYSCEYHPLFYEGESIFVCSEWIIGLF